MTSLEECLEKGYLKREGIDPALVKKELRESEYDLERAKKALSEEDFKWTIIKCYYSMFHAAKAVLFSLGLREKRHFAVQVALEDLSKRGKLEGIYLDYFSATMEAREDADYRYEYSRERAEEIMGYASKFITKMKELAKAFKTQGKEV